MKLNIGKTLLLGFGFFGVSILWAIHDSYVPVFLGKDFALDEHHTYSKFFSELIDTLIVYAVSGLQKNKGKSKKGLMVTGDDLSKNKSMFRMYSLIYPFVWLFSKLDALLFFTSGYMWIGKARVIKPTLDKFGGNGWHKDQPISIKN